MQDLFFPRSAGGRRQIEYGASVVSTAVASRAVEISGTVENQSGKWIEPVPRIILK
jgi:hypothetical protein